MNFATAISATAIVVAIASSAFAGTDAPSTTPVSGVSVMSETMD